MINVALDSAKNVTVTANGIINDVTPVAAKDLSHRLEKARTQNGTRAKSASVSADGGAPSRLQKGHDVTRPVPALIFSTTLVGATALASAFRTLLAIGLATSDVAWKVFALVGAGAILGIVLILERGDREQPPQQATRPIPVNRADGTRAYVELVQAGDVRDAYDRFGPKIPRDKFRHYCQWLHAEQQTPTMSSAGDEGGIDREGYRALLRWWVDAGWYTTANRDRYDNRNSGTWTPEKGERALASLYDGVPPAIVIARFTRPTPGGVSAASYAIAGGDGRAGGEN